MSLTDTLTSLGYTTEPGNHGRKRILRDGADVFSGTVHDVWEWLRERGEHACSSCRQRIGGDFAMNADGEPLCHSRCGADK